MGMRWRAVQGRRGLGSAEGDTLLRYFFVYVLFFSLNRVFCLLIFVSSTQ